MLDIVADVALIASAVGAILFVVLYAYLAPWRSSQMGWHVMAFMALVAVILCATVGYAIFGWNLERSVIRVAFYVPLAGVIWWRVVLLWRAQHAPMTPPPLRRGDDERMPT